MHLNTDQPGSPALPCIRDMNELVYERLSPQLIKLSALPELARCLHELVAEHPRFREEAPLVLVGEQQRRQRLSGALTLVVTNSLALAQHG